MQVGWVKIGDFRQIAGYILKTVQDRCMVSVIVEYEVVCALSNGGIAHDLECPQTTAFSAFCTAIHSFVTGEPRDFKFGTLTYHSKSHPVDFLVRKMFNYLKTLIYVASIRNSFVQFSELHRSTVVIFNSANLTINL